MDELLLKSESFDKEESDDTSPGRISLATLKRRQRINERRVSNNQRNSMPSRPLRSLTVSPDVLPMQRNRILADSPDAVIRERKCSDSLTSDSDSDY